MRTTIDVQDVILEEVVRQTGASSKKKAVEAALTEYVRFKRREQLSRLIGQYDTYEMTLDELKKMRHGV
jgi:Arc/MetJ family transcription regulator